MCHLRTLIAAALRDTAVSLGRLFAASSSTWEGSPPSLRVEIRCQFIILA